MTYTEFLRHVGKAGLTVRAFADLIKMNCVSLSNCAKKGEVPSHLAVIAALMGEMADNGVDYRSVIARIDITRKKPRGAGKDGRFGGDPERELDFFKPDPADDMH
ncbi:XRE family transcriptional regulator [Paraburkholderia tropica]|uniref:XRE family transcriptional regulator n=1 Tax=Paraburkholderia tropica TaxID=92647 RepID=UPI0032B42454